MTTVKQLIEYLQTVPPDTQIQVLTEKTIGYQTTTEFTNLEIGSNSYFFDTFSPKILEFGSR
jgi:hypothetical protein